MMTIVQVPYIAQLFFLHIHSPEHVCSLFLLPRPSNPSICR